MLKFEIKKEEFQAEIQSGKFGDFENLQYFHSIQQKFGSDICNFLIIRNKPFDFASKNVQKYHSMLHSAFNIAMKNASLDMPIFVEVKNTVTGRYMKDQEFKFFTKRVEVENIQETVRKEVLEFSGLDGAKSEVVEY